MDRYIHQDMCQPDTHHRHYKSNDGSDGQMLAMQQINAGGQVEANGEIKKQRVGEIVKRQIQLMIQNTKNSEKAKYALKE